MKKSALKWVIALMGFSLIGMIGFQLYWIDSVITANEERFTKDVLEAMNNVALKLEKQETVEAFNKYKHLTNEKPRVRQARRALNQKPIPSRVEISDSSVSDFLQIQSFDSRNLQDLTFETNFPTTQIEVFDTVQMGDDFQVVFNYQFSQSTGRNTIYDPHIIERHGVNENLENELEEKQTEIAVLEEKLDWVSRKYELTANVLDELLLPGRKLSNRFNPTHLDSLLSLELQDKGIHLTYDYGVVSPKTQKFVVLDDPEKKEPLEQSELRASLFPNDLLGNRAFLVLDFPGKSQYLLKKIWLTMVSSGILVFIIILCFGYSIRVILQQKKLSLMKNDFINNMTHEFKTPIATVSLATEALQDKDVLKSSNMHERYIKMIQEENQRLGSQVERVLQIAAIEKQDFNLTMEGLDLHKIIRSLIENMKIQVDNKGGRITSVFSAREFLLNGDETHISNCIMNLLDNANKYSLESPNIIVRTENKHDSLCISVQDHGMGMSKETQKHVFEKFYRLPTGNRHDVKGFGLGLSYVKNMVEAHEGSVEAESTLGKGSKFTITLPIT
ncbi:MAG: HAMP domain-containing histidine kinase [Cytophagales bacterium]|nr:HAMP domain-containing histidine kinase [Cytophagales bacterium]